MPPEEQAAGVRRVTWAGMAINIGLAALKMAGGILGQSAAVVADAVHSISDVATDLAILIGVRFWSKPPDECHPHGHRRIETVVTIVIGLSLAAVAIGLGYRSMASIGEPHGPPGLVALLAAGLSIVVKEALFRWTLIVGRRIRSTAVVANAWHHRSDAYSSVPAFIAVGGALLVPGWQWLDHLGAILVALFILHAAIRIMKPAYEELIDTGASDAEVAELARLAEGVAGVREVHGLRTRYHGGGLHVDLHVLVDPGLSVREGHDIGGAVKHRLLRDGPHVADVLVHLEPYEG